MIRGRTGKFVSTVAGGVACQAFVPTALPPVPPLDISEKLQARLGEAMLALGRLDAISTLLPDAHLFLYSYVRKEAVMSSQIEGTQSSLSDLMLYELEMQPGVPIDDVQEVSCYVAALNLGIELIHDGYPITYRFITKLHSALMTSGRGVSKSPGEFRKNQVWIGGHRADEASFVPTPSHLLHDCWSELEKFLNDEISKTDPLIKAALAHVQFETIHPFMDGNGRLGRLLIPLILVQAGVLKQPLLYLSVFFKRYRQIYYEKLQQVRVTGDWEAWLLFFADAVAATAAQAVETAQQLNQLRERDKQRISILGRQTGSARLILDALFELPIVTVSKLAEKTRLSQATINKTLLALENELGIVKEITGQKRSRVYIYSEYIKLLNKDD